MTGKLVFSVVNMQLSIQVHDQSAIQLMNFFNIKIRKFIITLQIGLLLQMRKTVKDLKFMPVVF